MRLIDANSGETKMINIEKTINNLEADWLRTTSREQHIVYVDVETVSCVLELLKKQTPMDIKPLRDSWPPQGVCPSCFTTIARYTVTGREQPYCAFCGQAVKWE